MAAWIFTLMVALLSPAKAAALPAFPGFAETAEERTVRYHAIAEAIAAATKDTREMAVLVAIAYTESAFSRDADIGPCYRGPGWEGRCDAGRAVSVFQLHARGPDDAKLLFGDRTLAASRAIQLVRRSVASCAKTHGSDGGLRAYVSGSCERGGEASARKVRLARNLLREHPPPDQNKPQAGTGERRLP